MRKIPARSTEKTASHSYRHDRFNPPLRIIFAGFSNWNGSHIFRRENSPVFSLNLVIKGQAVFEQGSNSYCVQEGEVFLPRRDCTHSFKAGPVGYLHKRFVVFDGPILDPLLRANGLWKCDIAKPESPKVVEEMLRKAYVLLLRQPPGFAQELSNLAYALLMEIGKSIVPDYPTEMRNTMEHVQRNPGSQVRLPEISERMGVSARHCNRLFKKHFGLPPLRFFQEERLEKAKDILLNTGQSIKEIAASLGFCDPFYFSSRFSRQFGLSPREFRKKHKTGKGSLHGSWDETSSSSSLDRP